MGKLVGGSLKLKTKQTQSSGIAKKSNSLSSGGSKQPHQPVKFVTQKTPAQMAFEAAQQKKQLDKLPSLASKSHKEKVAEFNEYLGKLSEHHDIPKVGPG